MMYAGAGLVGGVLIGGALATMYGSYSRYGYSNQRCWHQPTVESLSCRDCYRRYDDNECIQEGPRHDANRDDLMDTGFWPADWRGPLTVTVYSISGVDFTAAICPPANWSEASSDIMAPIGSSLYLTLTEVAELGDELEEDSEMSIVSLLASVLFAFCCCMCVATCFIVLLKKRQQLANHSEESVHMGGFPPSYGQGPAYASSYGQPAFSQTAYAQPTHGQQVGQGQVIGHPSPAMGQVVMGTTVPMGGAANIPVGHSFQAGESNPYMGSTANTYHPGQPVK